MIRLYTPTVGDGSLAIVGRGLASVFDELGLLSGIVSVDAPDDSLVDGVDAPIGLVVGSPNFLAPATRLGVHRKLILEYAPNSPNQPIAFHNACKMAGVSLIITPSHWAKKILVESWGDSIPIEVVRHGVDSRFSTVHSTAPADKFVVMHHAGSSPERKGTIELIRAINMWDEESSGPVLLKISGSMPSIMEIARSKDFVESTRVEFVVPFDGKLEPASWPESAIEQYRSCHVVCQPSRSEGFGMVPLEARACGVPVVMTTCTGHEEHVYGAFPEIPGLEIQAHGIVTVPEDEDAPMVCEMGGLAPRVDPEMILNSLLLAYRNGALYKQDALDSAVAVREKWSWNAQVAPWARRICEEMIE